MNLIEHYIKDNQVMDYDSIADFEKNLIKYRFKIISQAIENKKAVLLEIGSGNGGLCSYLKNLDVFSIDISQINNNSREIKIEGDAESLPLKKESFDIVILSQVLEHVFDINNVLNELFKVLKKDGLLILTVPYKEKIKHSLCIHCNQLTPLNAHLHSFGKRSLSKILSEAGFKTEKTYFFENKFLYMVHFFSLMGYSPFFFIRFIDNFLKFYYNRYNKMLMIAKKGQ